MKVEVCGSGCSKCAELEKRTNEAVVRAGIAAVVEHTYEVNMIIARGILLTPALVVDGKVVVSGKIPTAEQTAEMLKKAASGR